MAKGRVENLKTPSTELAREYQLKSAKARKKNRDEKLVMADALAKRLKAEDMDEWAKQLIARAMADDRSLELALAILGQKPADKKEIKADVSYESMIKAMRDAET